ncbi:chitinase [Actinoplanes rectilineatus]|uniref:chitinase n=1 Tax=Actinoplanes rectilineatus TaxID=113571 RepID=UPI0005F2FC1C|nr:chitinase [Actinoplanes rectilineatus]
MEVVADPDWDEPEEPVMRLSWLRVGFLIVIVIALGGAGTAGVMHLQDTAGPTAKSWAVPYVDVTLTPTFEFQDPEVNPANDIALAFVVADPEDSCAPSWGGYYSPDEAGATLELDRRISQLRANGGDVMLSVGGLTNAELAVACTDQGRLTDAYRQLVDRYELTSLDLDIEGTAVADQPSLERRALALKTIQDEREAAGAELEIWLTLPVAPTGLTAEGLGVVQTTLAGGVALSGVNIMTMDYGSASGSTTPDMLDLAEQALEATHRQLTDLYLRLGVQLTSREIWSRLGATPMIGQNDVDAERFTVEDASGLATYAIDKGLGRVSMWSLNRDAPCRGTFTNVVVHSNTCSGVDQETLAFTSVFMGLPGEAVGTSGREAVTIPTRTAAEDDPSTSPYPVWRYTAQYVRGYKVVWRGVVYEAKWTNQGVDPSTVTSSSDSPTPWSVVGPVGPSESAPQPSSTVTDVTETWNTEKVYARKDRVLFENLPYEARWSSKGEAPSTEYPIGPDEPWQPLFVIPGEPLTG